jgi:hypothetical protein
MVRFTLWHVSQKNLLAAITFLFCPESFQALSEIELALC